MSPFRMGPSVAFSNEKVNERNAHEAEKLSSQVVSYKLSESRKILLQQFQKVEDYLEQIMGFKETKTRDFTVQLDAFDKVFLLALLAEEISQKDASDREQTRRRNQIFGFYSLFFVTKNQNVFSRWVLGEKVTAEALGKASDFLRIAGERQRMLKDICEPESEASCQLQELAGRGRKLLRTIESERLSLNNLLSRQLSTNLLPFEDQSELAWYLGIKLFITSGSLLASIMDFSKKAFVEGEIGPVGAIVLIATAVGSMFSIYCDSQNLAEYQITGSVGDRNIESEFGDNAAEFADLMSTLSLGMMLAQDPFIFKFAKGFAQGFGGRELEEKFISSSRIFRNSLRGTRDIGWIERSRQVEQMTKVIQCWSYLSKAYSLEEIVRKDIYANLVLSNLDETEANKSSLYMGALKLFLARRQMRSLFAAAARQTSKGKGKNGK